MSAKKGRKSAADLARVLQEVEKLMRRGIDRPHSIARMADGVGDWRTAEKYMEIVREQWRSQNENTEDERKRLINEAREVAERAYVIVASAKGDVARCDALKVVLKAQERQAKLLGVDITRTDITHHIDVAELDALRERRVAESMAFLRVDPVKELYGVGSVEQPTFDAAFMAESGTYTVRALLGDVSEDSRQERPDGSAGPERTSEADPQGEA
jgi:hypothetical protein